MALRRFTAAEMIDAILFAVEIGSTANLGYLLESFRSDLEKLGHAEKVNNFASLLRQWQIFEDENGVGSLLKIDHPFNIAHRRHYGAPTKFAV